MRKRHKKYQPVLFAFCFFCLINLTRQSVEKNKGKIEKDEIRFSNGKFLSVRHAKKNFQSDDYEVSEKNNKTHFEVTISNNKNDTIHWRGTIQENIIEADYRWIKKGWLSNTVTDYSFEGKLK